MCLDLDHVNSVVPVVCGAAVRDSLYPVLVLEGRGKEECGGELRFDISTIVDLCLFVCYTSWVVTGYVYVCIIGVDNVFLC